MTGLTKGDVTYLNMPGNPLDGARVEFIKQSPVTGLCSVLLKETKGGYEKGERLLVSAHELH